MAIELIKKSCVKISVVIDGTPIKQGSGVILHSAGKFYVLTAYHCVEANSTENILIERQENYNSEFEKIKILSLIESDKTNDWALFEVDYSDVDLETILTAKKFHN